MSNRSKLPKGINRMRSHLEEVDDVPLLVPLFTDCTPSAVCEMVCIMQDYDDIVCCIGSSLNSRNHIIFSSSDVSIAIDPIFRKRCQTWKNKNPTLTISDDLWTLNSTDGPLHLSSMINSISCSLRCSRQEYFPMHALLSEARRLVFGVRSCFLFLVSCQVFLSALSLLTTCFLLPPPLSGLQTVWLLCVIIPMVSLSLIATPCDGELMKVITGKRKNHKYKDFAASFVEQFFLMFAVNALLVAMVLFPWLLNMLVANGKDHHWLLGDRMLNGLWSGYYTEHQASYDLAQDIILFYITLSFLLFSATFVHRYDLLWKRPPTSNRIWLVVVLLSFVLQTLHTCISIASSPSKFHKLTLISPLFYLVSISSMLIIIVISEVFKRKFIRSFNRFQNRERLRFDTKLGMNSPI